MAKVWNICRMIQGHSTVVECLIVNEKDVKDIWKISNKLNGYLNTGKDKNQKESDI